MLYAWMFVAAYALAFVGVLAWARLRDARIAEQLRTEGATETQIGSLYGPTTPPAALVVGTALFSGTILGAAGSLCYRLIG
jgi:hypothetical protein